mgnify:CR=1 FL=1|jgi:hypothetical protein|tara:strand:+ start:746 stop:1396 length:651 start_codon:yes stop_codon:yes gene_type:complete
MKTYLELINQILIRLRERQVSSVDANDYSLLIGSFVNQAKEIVENSWEWSGLRATLTADTSANVFNYVLTGSGNRMTLLDAINDTSNTFMLYRTAKDFDNLFLNGTPAEGSPVYYSFNGVDSNGDTRVDVYPIPDGAYALRFNLVRRTAELETSTDELFVPHAPVVALAYAMAVEERGEDGGMSSTNAHVLANRLLSDAIAFDAGKHPEELIWEAV